MKLFAIRFPKIVLFLLLSFSVSCGGGGGGDTPTQTLIASISVEPGTANLARGGFQQFSATARDAAGNLIPGVSFSWSADNPNFINIDSTGLGSGLAEGAATIRASAEGVTGTATVTVKAVQTIDLSPAVATLPKNSSLQFNAIARAADTTSLSGATFTWSTDNATFVAIDQNGLASGVAQGTATISALADGISRTATVNVTNPLFFDPTARAVGNTPESLAVGDFDGDGVQDLAVANAVDNTLSILRGSPDGSFALPANSWQTGDWPAAIVSGRFDAGTTDDLAIANLEGDPSSGTTLSIFLGPPTGAGTAGPSLMSGSGPISLATADFDGDGNEDLAIASILSRTVSTVLGSGIGMFQEQDAPNSFSDAPVAILAGRLSDNDTIPDLAVLFGSARKIVILNGFGDGTFVLGQTIANVGLNPNSITSGDWDGDGTVDLAVVNTAGLDITLLFGDGTTFQEGSRISLPGATNPRYVVTGDFNGDALADLAVSDKGNHTISILLNNGGGAFAEPVSQPTGQDPLAMTVGRFNSDNFDDLAVVNSGDHTVSIFLQFP